MSVPRCAPAGTHVGDTDGEPLLTITSAWALTDVALAAPSAAHLRTIGVGLAEARGWTPSESGRPPRWVSGVSPAWTPEALLTG